MNMVVDCHTHLLPQRLARKIRDFFEQHIIEEELAYTLDYRELLDRHHAAGISTIWNLPYAHKAGMASSLNEAMLTIASSNADHPVSIVTGCTVHPDDPDPAGDLVGAVAAGARVLKLHCSVGEFDLSDPRLSPVLDAAGELSVPVTVHAGRAVAGTTDAEELVAISEAAARHPNTQIILAHCGYQSYSEAIELLGDYQNLYADLTPVVFIPVPLLKADAERFADRLMFGSDAPNTGISASSLLESIQNLGIDATTLAKITHLNAQALVPLP